MKKRRPWRNRTLAFWLSIESVVVTLVTVAPFAMLHICLLYTSDAADD